MGFFSKKSKPNPVIETQGLQIWYDDDRDSWEFCYEGIDFVSYGSHFYCPTREQFTTMLGDIANLKPAMVQKLAEGWKEWNDVKMNDGEEYSVNLTEFHAHDTFEVSWSGGATWGDMMIDFRIRNHEITDEMWSD